MIFISAFPGNSSSGGEYVTELLLKYKYSARTEDIIILNDTDKEEYYNKRKKYFYFLFILIPILNPQITRRFSFKILSRIKKESEIVFNFTQTFVYSIFLKKCKKIFIVHDVLLQSDIRCKRYYLVPFTYLWEYVFFNLIQNAEIQVLNDKDKCFLERYYFVNSSKIKVIDIIKLISSDAPNNPTYNKNKPYKYGIIGAWSRNENYLGLCEFVKYYNKLNNTNSEILICGSNTNRIIPIIYNNTNIICGGFEENINDFFNKIEVLIIPINKGAGIKIKVLQALANNTICIGTKIAFEGIQPNQLMIERRSIKEIAEYLANE